MFLPLCFLGHGWNYTNRAFTTFEIREKYVLPWSSWVYTLPCTREEHQTPKLQDPKAGHTLKSQGKQTQHWLWGSPQIPEQGLVSYVHRAPWEIHRSQLKLPALYLGPSLRLQLQRVPFLKPSLERKGRDGGAGERCRPPTGELSGLENRCWKTSQLPRVCVSFK